MKILIAEDDTVSHITLKETLLKWGYKVIPTKDGAEAWDILQDKMAEEAREWSINYRESKGGQE